MQAPSGLDIGLLASFAGFAGVACGPRTRRPRYPYHPRRWWCFSRVYSQKLGSYVSLFDEEPPGDPGRLQPAECGRGVIGGRRRHRLPTLAASAKPPETRGLSWADVDLVVVGGGLAGAVAAKEAAGRGLKVALVEERGLGGFLGLTDLPLPEEIEAGEGSLEYFKGLRGELERLGVKLLEKSAYMGLVDEGYLVYTPQGPLVLRAPMALMATGGFSPLPLVEGNDLPGVVSAEYGLRLAAAPGIPGALIQKAVVLGAGEDALIVAGALARAGVKVTIVAWERPVPGVYAEFAAEHGVEFVNDFVSSFYGKRSVEGVETEGGYDLEVDLVVSALPAYPDLYPALQAGASWRFSLNLMAFMPKRNPSHEAIQGKLLVAGLAAGDRGVARTYGGAVVAGVAAAFRAGKASEEDLKTSLEEYVSKYGGADLISEDKSPPRQVRIERPLALAAGTLEEAEDAFIDPCNDVTVKELVESYHEDDKGLTPLVGRLGLGRGPEQGRMVYQTAAQVLSAAHNLYVDELGLPEPPHLTFPVEAWKLAG